jgi:hypothetical protein
MIPTSHLSGGGAVGIGGGAGIGGTGDNGRFSFPHYLLQIDDGHANSGT